MQLMFQIETPVARNVMKTLWRTSYGITAVNHSMVRNSDYILRHVTHISHSVYPAAPSLLAGTAERNDAHIQWNCRFKTSPQSSNTRLDERHEYLWKVQIVVGFGQKRSLRDGGLRQHIRDVARFEPER